MNTRPILDSSAGPHALSASFNADSTCFSVAVESGFRVFDSVSGHLKLAREVGGGIGYVELLETTKYIALVGGGKSPKFPQNKVQIWNDEAERVATSIEFKAPVQRVRISTTHLVVALLNRVGVYKMRMPPDKIADFETVKNPYGLCAMSKGVVAFPGRTLGQVKLFDFASGNVSIIPAHETPLRALALTAKGDMVATASEQGTLIRLWSFPSCTKLAEFRRGVDPSVIFSLAFSPLGSMVAVTSDKATLHIFNLPSGTAGQTPEAEEKTHKWGLLSKLPLLPRHFSDTYSSATTKIELGEEPEGRGPHSKSATFNAGIPGVPGGKPTQGLIGWLDDETLIVISAGQDAPWEKFKVAVDDTGKRVLTREGWKKYLES